MDFLKIRLPAILEKTETTLSKIQVRQNTMDLIFRLEDGSLLHLEEEAGVSVSDLLRFAQTDLMLYHEKRQTIHTVILSIHEMESCQRKLSMGSLEYQVIQVGLKGMDGDARMNQMVEDFREGRPINEIELLFIPLMRTEGSRIGLLERVIDLVKRLDKTEEEKAHMIACALVLMGKELKKADYDRFKKEVSMVNILKYAEEIAKEEGLVLGMEKGIEKGMEKGLEKGRIEGQVDLLWRMINRKFPGVSATVYERLKALDSVRLSILGDDLLKIHTLSELDPYVGTGSNGT